MLKAGTTEEAIAVADKIGFKTNLHVAINFIKNIKFRFILPTSF